MNGTVPPGLNATLATYSCSDVSMTWKRVYGPERTVPAMTAHRSGAAGSYSRVSSSFFQIDDQLRGARGQDAFERVRLRIVPADPDRFDIGVQRRPRHAVMKLHGR